MSRSDYAHHNEDADHMWWQEEGRFGSEEPEPDDDDFYAGYEDDEDDEPEMNEDAHLEMAYEDRFAMEDY